MNPINSKVVLFFPFLRVFMVQLNYNSYGTHCPLVFSGAFSFFGFLHRHFIITKYHYQRVRQDEGKSVKLKTGCGKNF